MVYNIPSRIQVLDSYSLKPFYSGVKQSQFGQTQIQFKGTASLQRSTFQEL